MAEGPNFCPLCQCYCGAAEIIGPVDNTHPGRFSQQRFNLLHCQNCDVIRLDPLPTEADLRVLYEESDQFTDPSYTDDERVADFLEYYGGCLDQFDLMPDSDQRCLEVGAGLSWVCRAVRLRNRNVTTVAQDVTDECADRCPWVSRYIVGTIDDVPQSWRFQLISLTHVIEHLLDPVEMIRNLSRRLEEDGRIFITAPYRPAGWNPGAGIDDWRRYSYLHVPAHISYLSRAWFEWVASDAGLEVVHWDSNADHGQAFEVVLRRRLRASQVPILSWVSRLLRK